MWRTIQNKIWPQITHFGYKIHILDTKYTFRIQNTHFGHKIHILDTSIIKGRKTYTNQCYGQRSHQNKQ